METPSLHLLQMLLPFMHRDDPDLRGQKLRGCLSCGVFLGEELFSWSFSKASWSIREKPAHLDEGYTEGGHEGTSSLDWKHALWTETELLLPLKPLPGF